MDAVAELDLAAQLAALMQTVGATFDEPTIADLMRPGWSGSTPTSR